MSVILVDSYGVENQNSQFNLYNGSATITSQSFTAKSAYLNNAGFYIRKVGSPTGNITVKLYEHSGTYGVSSVPTGAALATADVVDIETLTTTFELITFNFDGTYVLTADTRYCITIEYSGGSSTNRLEVGRGDNIHSGNMAFWWTQWIVLAVDCVFYIYGEEITPYVKPADTIKSLPTPISLKTTKEINGFWGADMDLLPDSEIDCEDYVDIDNESYVVKILEDIKDRGKYYQHVILYHNAIEELSAQTVDRISKLDTVENHLTTILAGSNWTAGACDIDETVFLITDKRVSMLEALTQLATISGGELDYHSLTHIVDLKRQIGTETGLHSRYDKNLSYIARIKNSTNLITRIYPYGSDNYTINTTILDDCEDEALYSASGAGTLTASTTIKMYGSMGIQINSSTLNETFIRDLAGNTVDLSGHTSLKFWIYSEVANANGFTFGIGEADYDEQTVNTGALSAMSWKEVELDLSSVADGDKDAIRYIGFKNLTGSAVEVVFDSIRAFDGNIYIDSDNAGHYKVKKEYVYQHSGKPEKTVFEKILYPTHDAYTSSAAPNSNFNSLVMGVQAGTVWNTFLKWDFTEIPADATIEEAVLSLTQYQGSGTLSAATTQLCATDWNENTITYNNQPSTSGASFHTWDFRSTGTINDSGDILTTVQNWFNSVTDNYGITIRTASGRAEFYSRNVASDSSKPQLKIKYSLTTDPEPIIKAGAMEKLYANDEPALMYKVKAADLSKVIADTWEDETIELGDTVKIYDYDLKDDDGNPLNVNVRVKKITKNLLDPSDMDIELANKSYTIVNENAELLKKLSYAMPFADKPNVVSANAVQVGYTGGEVNV